MSRRKRASQGVSEAERAVLGACLQDALAAADVLQVLRPRDCAIQSHELVLEAVEALVSESEPVDVLTVGARLESWGHLGTVGGLTYLDQLTDATPDVAHAAHYARLVRCESLRRTLEVHAAEAGEVAASGVTGAELDQELGRIYAGIADVVRQASSRRGGPRASSDLAREVVRTATAIADGGAQAVGIDTGIADLDAALGGLRPQGLYLLGATTSVGKTALALQIADRAATYGSTVVFFSLEMSAEQLVQRLLAGRTGVSCQLLVNGRLTEHSRRMVEAEVAAMPGSLLVDDTGNLTLPEIAARSRAVGIGGQVGLVVVDYLGLVTPTSRGRSREEEVGEVSRGLKALAKELCVPVLALSQLNRAADHSESGPQLYHLRESGRLEQDADVVLFLHRPEKGEAAQLRVAKNRQGPVGDTIRLVFDGITTRFRALPRLAAAAEPEDGRTWEEVRYGS